MAVVNVSLKTAFPTFAWPAMRASVDRHAPGRTAWTAWYHAAAAPAELSPSVPSQEAIRGQLAATAPHLYAALPDEKWRAFLALPQSVYYENQPVDSTELQTSLSHFDSVASTPQYHLLASEPVFQKVYGLLKRYTASATASGLSLPPPPAPSTVAPPAAASVPTQPVR